ncbi:hypothetical protein COO03_23840 [Bacillus sp. AFS098217]|uniref:hypothetical protein n=1 Tax=unclassified Bacillus (in: firmicutes) TaxID=185979 RepID=UPI000BEC5CD2|nr:MULTISPECIES: hypothetical protein [unclassified Bacillus (in: firmicutes)]PEB49118.1 hypothetical protein COO03_23840 [Bacillus sp. AFS098217]PEU07653.1 hypothetical protein CN525_26560 [Bacillus sp. AFS014408]PEU08234.1 hypothetical protein CN524_19000 [Bacillus sp. AFS019443]PFW55150.1 hypothetical protein COL20_27385 [Bacillus sp. AFS075034]
MEEKVALENIEIDDTVVIFTGEYMPKEVGKNIHVYAGSILHNGLSFSASKFFSYHAYQASVLRYPKNENFIFS